MPEIDDIGILDFRGTNINPLNNKPYSDKYKSLATKWSKLPAYEKRFEILKDLANHDIILIVSGIYANQQCENLVVQVTDLQNRYDNIMHILEGRLITNGNNNAIPLKPGINSL